MNGETTSSVLTCVYCGKEYPEGTPAWGSQVLTDHIKVCEKHPMRELEVKYRKVRKALADMIGCDNKQELDSMESIMRIAQVPEVDRVNMLNAIDAVRSTIDCIATDSCKATTEQIKT